MIQASSSFSTQFVVCLIILSLLFVKAKIHLHTQTDIFKYSYLTLSKDFIKEKEDSRLQTN
ncbi:hypothetical protein DQM68_08910 [Leptospira mayottensis]|uniref:Uncharacterized protein n=1 Tax=Leptospira mayottensis TaxID=1137606 RepID=A0ABN5NW52_9LEPT|nr:hypothetical protein DQM68_08910 [Leptospira mayottensis]AXR64654.1 hypothetical protein DQM28_10930 [Leptospira mayottensis]AZQ02785.1 hypothetical protein LEP1GSC190_12780 [Leptospira mayottensis 200901116]